MTGRHLDNSAAIAAAPCGWRDRDALAFRAEAGPDRVHGGFIEAFDFAGLSLFRNIFFDARARTLTEYFADDLSPAPGDMGRIVEPGQMFAGHMFAGHMFEWAWILASAPALPDAKAIPASIFYHPFLAISELERLQSALEATL